MNVDQLASAFSLIALWTIALLRRDHAGLPVVAAPVIKFTHVLPSLLQIALFAYWALYWQGVVDHLPVIGAQLLFAYAVDFLLAWSLRRPYVPSLAPVPVVLSTNLFVWFPPQYFLLGLLVIAIALFAKALIRFNGRHIFNPSVFGIAVVALLCIVLPSMFHYRDMSHDFDRPPHMAHVILLLALIPQLRLGVAPVAVGAALSMIGTMMLVFALTGYRGGPSPWWPPWLLAITLLASDPATIPSTPISRLLFGLFLGAGFYVVSRLMLVSIGTDFFSKIIPIPVANLLAPFFESVGIRLSSRWPGLGRNGTNRAFVAAWVSMSVLVLLGGRHG